MKTRYIFFPVLILVFCSFNVPIPELKENVPVFQDGDFASHPFSISPNPVKSELKIISQHFSQMDTQLLIYNTSGQRIMNIMELLFNEDNEASISMDYLSSGLYFIQLRSGNYSATKKVIKI